MSLGPLLQSVRTLKRGSMNWRLVGELRTFRPQCFHNQLENLEEPWRPEETCCHSESNEKSSVRAGLKNSQVGQTTRPSDSQWKNSGLCCTSRPQIKIEIKQKIEIIT